MKDAMDDLGPILNRIYEIVTSGVGSLTDWPTGQRAIMTPRTRANLIHDNMKYQALLKLQEGVPGVRISTRRGQFLIFVQDKYRIRLKKLDKNRRPSNYPTRRALSYLNMEQSQLHVDDAPPPVTDLVAGYQFDVFETGLNGVYIVCPKGKENEWEFEVSAPASGATVATGFKKPAPDGGKRVWPKVTPGAGSGEDHDD